MASWEIVRRRATFAGRVLEAPGGRPVAGARVEITAAPPAFAARPATRTATDGHFHFLDLPAGDYTLTAALPGQGSRYGTVSAQVTLSGDPVTLATVDLTLPATTVHGKVVDSEDNAVPMAELRLRGGNEITYSNGQGEYALRHLEAGSRVLVISARGFEKQTKTVVLGQAGADVEVEVTLQPSTP